MATRSAGHCHGCHCRTKRSSVHLDLSRDPDNNTTDVLQDYHQIPPPEPSRRRYSQVLDLKSTDPWDTLLQVCRRGDRQHAMDTVLHISTLLAAGLLVRTTGGELDRQDQRAKDGTALFWACSHGFDGVVHALITLGARVDCKSLSSGATPLHASADHDRVDITRYLLAHGADVSATTKLGDTACHLAAYRGHHRVVRALLKAGSPWQALNWRNHDVLDEAKAGGKVKEAELITRLVAKYGASS